MENAVRAQLHYSPLGNQGNLPNTFLSSFLSYLFVVITINQPSHILLAM